MMPDPGQPAQADAPRSVAHWQHWGAVQLGVEGARRESELLLGHALQRDRAWLFAHAHDPVADEAAAQFRELIAERVRGVPVAQLLGAWGFWNLDLRITAAVLIPRSETELLVEAALERLPQADALRIADLGTGSGAIALAIAKERPGTRVVAVDASPPALALAQENATRLQLANVECREGSWYAPLAGERFDLIVSNPPYIADGDPHLQQGDLRFEPSIALSSGSDGLDAIRCIVSGAPRHLLEGGWLLLEHGLDQGAAVRGLMQDAGLVGIETRRDLEGRERISFARLSMR